MNSNDFVVGLAVTGDSLLFAIIVLSGFLCLAVLVSMMLIYKKFGKPSISAFIPIWSQIVLFQIVGIKIWWLFVPVVNIVFMWKAYILLAKKFGKGVWFGIGMIFLPMIFIPLLSFYDYNEKKEQPVEETVYNPSDENNIEQVMPSMPIMSELVDVSEENHQETIDENQQTINNNMEAVNLNVSSMSEEILNDNYVSGNDNFADQISDLGPVNLSSSANDLSSNFSNVESNVDSVIPTVEHFDNNVENFNVEEMTTDIDQNTTLTVQDIGAILNNKKELKDVAFAETASKELVNYENINEAIELPVAESNELSEENDSIIEMPERAAKICPACGIGLGEDIKYCTACGTQL